MVLSILFLQLLFSPLLNSFAWSVWIICLSHHMAASNSSSTSNISQSRTVNNPKLVNNDQSLITKLKLLY